MDEITLRNLLAALTAGDIDGDEAVRRLRAMPFADLGHTKVDHHRDLRLHMAEAIYGPGKSPEQCAAIVAELLDAGTGPVVLTRADDAQAAAVLAVAAHGRQVGSTIVWRPRPSRPETVTILTAGTADGSVADECATTLVANGFSPARIDDVGVAGLHRLLAEIDRVQQADAVVVIAGMEGALASVVGGLTPAPVVAVPTSTGYGASFEGVTALLAMLASCASGVTVVGIDNGFGAACAVVRLFGAGARHG